VDCHYYYFGSDVEPSATAKVPTNIVHQRHKKPTNQDHTSKQSRVATKKYLKNHPSILHQISKGVEEPKRPFNISFKSREF
jgi:hypothetical protein